MSSPTPYVPPEKRPDRDKPKVFGGPANDDPARPWMALRPGESIAEWNARVSSSCWKCGVHIVDRAALDAHEATH